MIDTEFEFPAGEPVSLRLRGQALDLQLTINNRSQNHLLAQVF